MYIPSYFQETDQQKLIEFMHANSFATLVSSENNYMCATHLPFVVEQREDKLYLISHMAKANPQWKAFTGNESLIIFQGPHGYISPTHYEKKQNVPTWNYIAVHAYGIVKCIEEQTAAIHVLEKTIFNYEASFYKQWKELSPDYKTNMVKGIVAFEVEVLKLEGKYKLSQNKTKTEQQNIVTDFEKSSDSRQLQISEEMKKKL
jgi:transcriptional regulator